MNKRIQEIAEQAGAKFPFGGFVNYDQFDCEKFAESIMKECVEIAEPKPQDVGEWSAGMRLVQKRINEHFGLIEQEAPYNRCLL